MTKLLQINITANWGSHGKIAEGIGLLAIQEGWESHIAYGRWMNPSASQLYHIGSRWDEAVHGLGTRILDNHGLMSKGATRKLIRYISQIRPDIIHLHNIHGYYLNYPILFRFLKESGIPVIWTLHDCWSYTGHCAHYMFAGCRKWEEHCHHCAWKSTYPRSIMANQSYKNFEQKRLSFLSLDNLTLVPVSKWLENDLKCSFFKDNSIVQLYNGIDCQMFKPTKHSIIKQRYHIPQENKIVIGVASNWYRKGLPDFLKLRTILSDDYSIILVGLNKKDIKNLPKNIIGLQRTQNQEELVELYSAANVYFNPTWEDNFPTTNLEAMACGIPVVTYQTGGSPESIDSETGFVVDQGNVDAASKRISEICANGRERYRKTCRERIITLFEHKTRFADYMTLYKNILKQRKPQR